MENKELDRPRNYWQGFQIIIAIQEENGEQIKLQFIFKKQRITHRKIYTYSFCFDSLKLFVFFLCVKIGYGADC